MKYFVHGDIADGVGMTDEFLDKLGLHNVLLDIIDLSIKYIIGFIQSYTNAILGGGDSHEGRGRVHGGAENTIILSNNISISWLHSLESWHILIHH